MTEDFHRLIEYAPNVTCPGCLVGMNIREIERRGKYVALTYRCPKCQTDTVRHIRSDGPTGRFVDYGPA